MPNLNKLQTLRKEKKIRKEEKKTTSKFLKITQDEKILNQIHINIK